MYYNRIDISEEIDSAKSSGYKECMVCHYWFFNHGFKYQYSSCNFCHDLLMQCVNVSNIAITTVKCAHYHWIIDCISKSDAINLLKNVVLDDNGIYKKCMSLKSMLKINSKTLLFWQSRQSKKIWNWKYFDQWKAP